MLEIIGYTIIIALFVSYFINVLNISGLRDYLLVRCSKLLYQMLSCDFCLGFWISALITFGLVIITGNYHLLIIPSLTSSIIKKLL